ncbi:MAG TPA: hypothetical protein PLV92_13645, partial [Pirellulaceae bacterium]|nr:hypothetical protein [Pirellulaceae bacterium]
AKPSSIAPGQGRASWASDRWSYLLAPGEASASTQLGATVTIDEPSKRQDFFGSSWSAWPDPTFGDGGFDAGLLLKATIVDGRAVSGYRIQISHKYQTVALVKFPDGGYVRAVACKIPVKQPIRISAETSGREVVVAVNGAELFRWRDEFLPLAAGRSGVGVGPGARATWEQVEHRPLAAPTNSAGEAPMSPRKTSRSLQLSSRKFLGDRVWVFDGDEPILQLHHAGDPSCFAKLRPGYKPQLTFDSHWGLENQGAFPEAASKWTDPVVSGGGETLRASWSARNVKDRFTTKSTLTVGFDERRGVYTYEIESELEVLPGEPFHFRYGFDFEHHTPLDPFRWQYLMARRRTGELYHRPVYPIDPGPQNDLDMVSGTRVWFGRHGEAMQLAPAVEYLCSPADTGDRPCNTAVCAAFYDTGVSFAPETAKPGTKLKVRYRYTGVPADEAQRLFEQSKVYDSFMLDPQHHYIFADEWPKLTFSQFAPLSQSWIYGRNPFMTAHNTRPSYELQKNCGAGSGFAMKLGAASFGKANLPIGKGLAKGRYIASLLVKADNVFGPGGRVELQADQAKTNKRLLDVKHYVGNGSFDWRKESFAFELSDEAAALSLAFGNAGTGEVYVTEVEFRKLGDGEPLPAGCRETANERPASIPAAPRGAVADYRMEEGRGRHVLNYAPGPHLELANLKWVRDAGRSALSFDDSPKPSRDFRSDGNLYRSYLSHPAYAERQKVPVALSGFHGGGEPIKGLTLAAWIKPAGEMGTSQHGGKGDIVGYGARRFILSLHGQKAPYQLAARINVNDVIMSSAAEVQADKWQHVALTATPSSGQWQIRVLLDGREVASGVTQKCPIDAPVVSSIILGAEIFYLHDAYYRGLIGRTV